MMIMSLSTGSNKKKPSHRRNSAISCLTEDFHYLILDKLLDPLDHLRYQVVCKDWFSTSKSYNHTTHRWRNMALPMLLIPPLSSTSIADDWKLHSTFEDQTYKNTHFPDNLCTGIMCGGSSHHGWFLLISQRVRWEDYRVRLVNIFRKGMVFIHLPLLPYKRAGWHEWERISSITLSMDPHLNPDDYVAVITCRTKKLAFTKGWQQECWTQIDPIFEIESDPIFYRDRVYVAGRFGGIMSVDLNTLEQRQVTPKLDDVHARARAQARARGWAWAWDRGPSKREYLVKSAKGDFLWHVRRADDQFKVYKVTVDDDSSIAERVEVKNIGDEALFVGECQCISILASSSFPTCQHNSIYYMNDWPPPSERSYGKSVQIFNLEDCASKIQHSTSFKGPAFWAIPPLTGLY